MKQDKDLNTKIINALENKPQRIVINNKHGGFSLSAKAVKRLAELNGKKCYFFKHDYKTDIYSPLSLEECNGMSLFWFAFSVPNPDEVLPKIKRGKDGTYKDYNDVYNKIYIGNSPDDRTDPNLIKVVEELGKDANGRCASLKIVEVPYGVEWEISEYDGWESVEEVHRSWN